MVLTSRNEKHGLNAAVAVPLGKQGVVDAVEVLQGNQGLMDAVVMVRRHASITTTTELEAALLFPGSVVWSGSTGMATTNRYCTPEKKSRGGLPVITTTQTHTTTTVKVATTVISGKSVWTVLGNPEESSSNASGEGSGRQIVLDSGSSGRSGVRSGYGVS